MDVCVVYMPLHIQLAMAAGSDMEGDSMSSSHINYLELLAAFFALKAFCLNCQCCTVQLQLDNSTAVTYINNMGGGPQNLWY